jgi:hypothetical protein
MDIRAAACVRTDQAHDGAASRCDRRHVASQCTSGGCSTQRLVLGQSLAHHRDTIAYVISSTFTYTIVKKKHLYSGCSHAPILCCAF